MEDKKLIEIKKDTTTKRIVKFISILLVAILIISIFIIGIIKANRLKAKFEPNSEIVTFDDKGDYTVEKTEEVNSYGTEIENTIKVIKIDKSKLDKETFLKIYKNEIENDFMNGADIDFGDNTKISFPGGFSTFQYILCDSVGGFEKEYMCGSIEGENINIIREDFSEVESESDSDTYSYSTSSSNEHEIVYKFGKDVLDLIEKHTKDILLMISISDNNDDVSSYASDELDKCIDLWNEINETNISDSDISQAKDNIKYALQSEIASLKDYKSGDLEKGTTYADKQKEYLNKANRLLKI